MRRFVLTWAAAAVLTLAAATAEAVHPHGNYQSNFAPNYGYQVNNYYGGGYGGWGGGLNWRGGDFAADAARIRAAHSPYRYYTHPRSLYNAPPGPADFFGWEW